MTLNLGPRSLSHYDSCIQAANVPKKDVYPILKMSILSSSATTILVASTTLHYTASDRRERVGPGATARLNHSFYCTSYSFGKDELAAQNRNVKEHLVCITERKKRVFWYKSHICK